MGKSRQQCSFNMMLYKSKLKQHETINYLETTVKSIKTFIETINTMFKRMLLLGRKGVKRELLGRKRKLQLHL